MSSHITSPFLQKTDPDKYGQRHPIESPVLVQSSLILLHEELEKISLEEKEHFLKAKEICPDIVTDAHMIVFLRCEQFNVDVRAFYMFVCLCQNVPTINFLSVFTYVKRWLPVGCANTGLEEFKYWALFGLFYH
jgi:hypothetical protein